jgi:arabinose-5-phosphate isomerase
MHAADAIHGDIGIVQREDTIICISKSGETPEIKVLIPLLKNFGNKLIALVSNKESYLGIQSDYILHTPIAQEADPNNLAPTASTTSQMAMGDALAVALLAVKGFSSQDFAQFHPGGALGKQLYLRVRDIYPQHGTPSVYGDTNLKNTIIEMTSQRLGATAVLDDANRIIGVITDGDLRRMLVNDLDIKTVTAQNVMTPHPLTIHADELAVNAMEVMRRKSITQLIVVGDDNQYLGMIHLHDLIKEGIV